MAVVHVAALIGTAKRARGAPALAVIKAPHVAGGGVEHPVKVLIRHKGTELRRRLSHHLEQD
eukprot:6192716-Pleurochrysis_carterae.AAC.5